MEVEEEQTTLLHAEKKFKFYCPRCEHGTDFKGNLISHLQSKKECKVKVSNISREAILKDLRPPERKLPQVECSCCKKLVAKANLARHVKTCKEKPLPSTSESKSHETKIVFESKEELDKLIEAKIKEFLTTQSINNTTYNTVNNHTYNITINPFGHENISHLTNDFLSYCILNPKKGITQLIENIHYNKDVPENRNIRYKSTKQNTFERFKDNQWIECDASNTLDELIRKGYRILNNHYINNFLNDPAFLEDELRQSVVERFRFLDDPTCNSYFSAKRDVRLLIKNKTIYVVADATENDDDVIDNSSTS